MGCIHTASLAHERGIFGTNPTAARQCCNVCYSDGNWSIGLVCGPDSRRLPPASTTLAGAGETRGGNAIASNHIRKLRMNQIVQKTEFLDAPLRLRSFLVFTLTLWRSVCSLAASVT
jgi:hypothetical protein